MDKKRTVVDSIGIMHDRDSLSLDELRNFVERTKNVKNGVLERNSSCSDHEYVTWDLVVYE
jgi:hypothetical protein